MIRRAVAEIIAEPGGPRRDWSSRARSSAAHALRYSKFVGVMKRALPAAAFTVIAVVLVFFFVQHQPRRLDMAYERMGLVKNDLAMIRPRLSGTDSKGNPFVITADEAIQDPKNFKRAQLKNVRADLTLADRGWIDASAAAGIVDLRAGALALSGGLSVYSDNGYELHTARADVDLNKGIMRGGETVTGRGPAGTLRADRFQVDRNSGRFLLAGNVRMTLERKATP